MTPIERVTVPSISATLRMVQLHIPRLQQLIFYVSVLIVLLVSIFMENEQTRPPARTSGPLALVLFGSIGWWQRPLYPLVALAPLPGRGPSMGH
jgi:hypothetical protein